MILMVNIQVHEVLDTFMSMLQLVYTAPCTTVYGSQGGLNYENRYRVHEARRPSLAVEGTGPRMRRGSSSTNIGGPSGGYRKYRSTGNLSGKPHQWGGSGNPQPSKLLLVMVVANLIIDPCLPSWVMM